MLFAVIPDSPEVTTETFLAPRFVGGRFVDHSIPLEVFKDLAALEEIIVEAAKWIYKKDNRRKRGPKYFRKSVSLKLEGVRKGSAVASLQLEVGPDIKRQEKVYGCMEAAKDAIFQTFDAASRGDADAVKRSLPPELIARFGKVGASLRRDEFVELNPEGGEGRTSRLDHTTRAFIVNMVDGQVGIEEPVEVVGKVFAIDAGARTFKLDVEGSPAVLCKMGNDADGEEQFDLGVLLLSRVRDGARAVVSGIGTVNAGGSVQSIEPIHDFEELTTRDLVARLDDIRDADQTLAVDGAVLDDSCADWLVASVGSSLFAEGSSPAVFVVDDGDRILFEWSIGPSEVSLEIRPVDKSGVYHVWDASDDSESEHPVDLSGAAGWDSVAADLNLLLQKASIPEDG